MKWTITAQSFPANTLVGRVHIRVIRVPTDSMNALASARVIHRIELTFWLLNNTP